MKRKTKKLSLNRETLLALASLEGVDGAGHTFGRHCTITECGTECTQCTNCCG